MVLCRPLVSDDPFPEPASVRRMALELFVTEAAIKQHLQNLYDKFSLGIKSAAQRSKEGRSVRSGSAGDFRERSNSSPDALRVRSLASGHRCA